MARIKKEIDRDNGCIAIWLTAKSEEEFWAIASQMSNELTVAGCPVEEDGIYSDVIAYQDKDGMTWAEAEDQIGLVYAELKEVVKKWNNGEIAVAASEEISEVVAINVSINEDIDTQEQQAVESNQEIAITAADQRNGEFMENSANQIDCDNTYNSEVANERSDKIALLNSKYYYNSNNKIALDSTLIGERVELYYNSVLYIGMVYDLSQDEIWIEGDDIYRFNINDVINNIKIIMVTNDNRMGEMEPITVEWKTKRSFKTKSSRLIHNVYKTYIKTFPYSETGYQKALRLLETKKRKGYYARILNQDNITGKFIEER